MFKRLNYKDLEQKKHLIIILGNTRHKIELNVLMLIVLAQFDVSLANVLPIDYFKWMSMCITKNYAETFLDLRK